MASFTAEVLAGAAIGCVLFGVVLGTLMACFTRRLQRKPQPRDPISVAANIAYNLRHQLHGLLEGFPAAAYRGHHSRLQRMLHLKVRILVNTYFNGCSISTDIQHQPSAFTDLAGYHKNWEHLAGCDDKRRMSILTHFICRFLYRRMIPDGDLGITLLPVDVLSTYQRMLTKCQPMIPSHWHQLDKDIFEKSTYVVIQYWRALTVYWGSERHFELLIRELPRSGCMQVDTHSVQETHSSSEESLIRHDDPRMPQVMAAEAALMRALSPFATVQPGSLSGVTAEGEFGSQNAQRALRQVLTIAADSAIMAFADPASTEFYWPPRSHRDGYDSDADDAMLECFGILQRFPVPGLENHTDPITTSIISRPKYSDSLEFENVSEARKVSDMLGKGVDENDAFQKVLEERRLKIKEFEDIQKEPWEWPGWEGRQF